MASPRAPTHPFPSPSLSAPQPVGQKRVQGNQNKYMPGHGPPMEGGRCPDSGSNLLMGGPIWSQPLHDFDFVQGGWRRRCGALDYCSTPHAVVDPMAPPVLHPARSVSHAGALSYCTTGMPISRHGLCCNSFLQRPGPQQLCLSPPASRHAPSPPAGLLSDLSAPTASSDFAQAAKIRGLLLSVAAELPDAPLYYDLHDVCRTVRCTAPKSDVFKSALVNAGYRCAEGVRPWGGGQERVAGWSLWSRGMSCGTNSRDLCTPGGRGAWEGVG